MNHVFRFQAVLAVCLFAPTSVPAERAVSPFQDDLAWIEQHGTLLFADTFDREVNGNGELAIGNGWTNATADRVPNIRQADIQAGVLKVTVAKAAGHGAHIHHDAGLRDGAAFVRFKLPGLTPEEMLTVGYVDRQQAGIHAGHIGYVFINGNGTLTIRDHKTGVSDLQIIKRRDPYLKSKQKLPADLEAFLATKQRDLKWKSDHEWHDLLLVVEGDEMRVQLDGKSIGALHSEGFAHPTKRWFSLGINTTAWIDEVRLWKFR